MPTEQQELQLKVTLDDEASPQLAKIREALAGIGAIPGGGSGGGRSVGGMSDADKAIGSLTRGLLGVGRQAVELAKAIGPMPVALGTLAYQLHRTSEATEGWAVQMVKVANAARMAGTSIGDFRSVVDSLGRAGMSAQAAGAMMVRFNQAYGELVRAGSARREQLINMAGPEFANNMMLAIRQIGTLRTDVEKLDYIRRIGENVYQNELRRSNDEALAAYKRDKIYAAFGADELSMVDTSIIAHSKITQENMKAEAEALKKIHSENTEAKQTWERIAELMKAQFAPFDIWAVNKVIAILKPYLERLEHAEHGGRLGRTVVGDIGRGLQGFGPGGALVGSAIGAGASLYDLATGGGDYGDQPLSQLGKPVVGGGTYEKAGETTEDNTHQLTRLTTTVQKIMTDPKTLQGLLSAMGGVRAYARGGTTDIATAAVVAEAGEPETVVNSSGARTYDRPTMGVLKPGDTVVPTYEEEYTKRLIGGGAGPTDVKNYLAARGIYLNEADCAKYMTSLVATRGGAMPPEDIRYAASSWNKGPAFPEAQEGYSSDPYAINWAVWQRPGINIGQPGEHVTEPIPETDAQGNFTGKFINRGVNQDLGDIARQQLTEKDPKNVPYKQYHEFPLGMQSLVASKEMLQGVAGGAEPAILQAARADEAARANEPVSDQSIRIPASGQTASAGGGAPYVAGDQSFENPHSTPTGTFPSAARDLQRYMRGAGTALKNAVLGGGGKADPGFISKTTGLPGEHAKMPGFHGAGIEYAGIALSGSGILEDFNKPAPQDAAEIMRRSNLPQIPLGGVHGEGSDLDKPMGNELHVATSGNIKIEHDNPPPGTTIETDGKVFEGGEKQTTVMPMMAQGYGSGPLNTGSAPSWVTPPQKIYGAGESGGAQYPWFKHGRPVNPSENVEDRRGEQHTESEQVGAQAPDAAVDAYYGGAPGRPPPGSLGQQLGGDDVMEGLRANQRQVQESATRDFEDGASGAQSTPQPFDPSESAAWRHPTAADKDRQRAGREQSKRFDETHPEYGGAGTRG